MITKSTIRSREFTPPYLRVEVPQVELNNQTIALVGAVSKEIGVDLAMTFDHSVNIEKFKIFLEELRAKYFFDDICIYFDNLSVHRSQTIRDRLDELSIAYVYSPLYSPDFNGIESVFSIFKN